MEQLIQAHEATIRLSCFVGVFAIMALWELFSPRRALTVPKPARWTANLGIVVINTVLLRLLFPAAAVGMALLVKELGWGLFNVIAASYWLAVIIGVVALDFFIWLQHVMFHAVPALWRLHRMHHADLDFDVTTGLRFHPVEIVLSMLIKFAVIALLGPPLLAVIIFEILLNATAMFSHGNVCLPRTIDRVLRLFVVTPDMHRVHHSIEDDETNSNFGFNLPWWDRLLGTYRDQPRDGHDAMTIGITTFRDPAQCDRLPAMLRMPFIGEVEDYAINRRHWR